MTTEIWTVLGILAAAAGLFAWGRVRSDAVGVLVMISLMATGLLTVEESLSGFSEPVVMIIVAMFIVSQALVETGLAQGIGDQVLKASRGSEARLVALLMISVGTVGAFMSSTAVVAVFIPIALSVADKAGLNRKRLLMPLGVAGMISGMMTLVATAPNLIVNQMLVAEDLAPLGFFSFTPFGIGTLLLAILFMLLLGRGMLSKDLTGDRGKTLSTARALTQSYGLEGHRLRVQQASPFVGRALSLTEIRHEYGFHLIAIQRVVGGRPMFLPVQANSVLEANDNIILLGNPEKLEKLSNNKLLAPTPRMTEREHQSLVREVGVAEIMLTPDSKFVGQTLVSTHFRSTYDLSVVAIRRRGTPIISNLGETSLDFGDVLLAIGSWERVLELAEETQHFVLLTLPAEHLEVRPGRRRAPRAVAILGLMVLAMATQVVPTVLVALLTACALVALRCVPLGAVYRSIGWQSVVLVATILPLATALQKSGAADLVAISLINGLGGGGTIAIITAVFLLTSTVGLFISNTATAVLIAPIAIDAALKLGLSPYAFAMTVAIASSAAYLTPVSSPGNTLIQEPGGYRFSDYVKVGVPVQLLTLGVTLLLVWWRYL